MKELSAVPGTAETFALVPVGHRIGQHGPTTRWSVGEVLHHERWDQAKT